MVITNNIYCPPAGLPMKILLHFSHEYPNLTRKKKKLSVLNNFKITLHNIIGRHSTILSVEHIETLRNNYVV